MRDGWMLSRLGEMETKVGKFGRVLEGFSRLDLVLGYQRQAVLALYASSVQWQAVR